MKLVCITLATVAALTLAAAAGSTTTYDRSPIHVAALTPDRWGQATSKAETALRGRYAGIRSDYCVGAIMIGHEPDSSFVQGLTRYWDKLVCAGQTYGGTYFALIYDAKGPSSWIIYRLKDASIRQLVNG